MPSNLRWLDAVETGAAGYTDQSALLAAWQRGRLARSWWMGPRLVSGQLIAAEGKGIWKDRARLPLSDPGPQLDTLAECGIPHPSSYSDVFHTAHRARVGMPRRLPATYNRLWEGWSGGPWSEALDVGRLPGTWRRYDLRQAYRWAATLGLPDMNTVTVRARYRDAPGLWWATIRGAERLDLAPALKRGGPVVLSTEEIEQYALTVDVIRGATWERTEPGDYIERTLETVPCPRECGRAYWGRWIARDPLTVRTPGKAWDLGHNPWLNFLWGWLIVARVRGRVWEARRMAPAAHVYVDEIVTRAELPADDGAVGAWHLKEIYSQGIDVYRTGHFGPVGGGPAMQTGVTQQCPVPPNPN